MKLVKFNINSPLPVWTEVIPETECQFFCGGYLFAKYLKDAITFVQQYDYNGKHIRDIKLPGIGTARGFLVKKKSKIFIIHSRITLHQVQSTN